MDNKLKRRQVIFLRIFPKKMCNISLTCRASRICRRTYYNWMKSSKVFRDEVDSIREGLYDDIETIILNKILVDRDTTMLIYYMKCKMKDRGYFEN